MVDTDPRDAVVGYLVAPAGVPVDGRGEGSGEAGRPVARLYSGKPYVARRDSIEFVKARGLEDRRLFAVVFDDLSGNRWSYLIAAEREDQRWIAHDVAGGSSGPASKVSHPARSHMPKVDVYGHWGPSALYVAAKLDGVIEQPTTLVRLTLVDGTQLTDDPDGDVALFVARHGSEPSSVETLDEADRVLSSHKAF